MDFLQVGDKAPAFSTIDQNGVSVSLNDFKGKKIVIYFYPKDNTPGCTKEACAFRDTFSAFKKHHVDVLGVSVDSEKAHKNFATKFELPFRLLVDTDKTIVQTYKAWGEKSMYGRTYMGVFRITYLIDEHGKIAKVYPKVKPDEHANEILVDLKTI